MTYVRVQYGIYDVRARTQYTPTTRRVIKIGGIARGTTKRKKKPRSATTCETRERREKKIARSTPPRILRTGTVDTGRTDVTNAVEKNKITIRRSSAIVVIVIIKLIK